MTARLAMFTIDCADPERQAAFYAELLGMQVGVANPDYAMLTGEGPALGFGRVEGYEPPAWPNPNGTKRFHLDVAVEDVDATEAQALALGARLADPQPGESWRVLLDPSGHPFCLTSADAWS